MCLCFAAKVGGSIDVDEWMGLPKMVRKDYHHLFLLATVLYPKRVSGPHP